MFNINFTEGNEYFTLNGKKYTRVYQAVEQGTDSILIYGVHDIKNQLLSTTHYSNFTVNGDTYNSQDELITVLIPILYEKGSITGGTGTGGSYQELQNQINLKEDAFSKNTAFNKNFGQSSGTVAQGNDPRFSLGSTAYGWGDHNLMGYITGIDNITSIPNRSYLDLQNLPVIDDEVSFTNNNTNSNIHRIATVAGNIINESVTQLNTPTLNGNILTLSFTNENEVTQTVTIDLSTLNLNETGITNATYDASQNVITLTEQDGDVWNINLSEFSIITNTDANGITTLNQEGEVKVTISKVGQTGQWNDLLSKPTTLSGFGLETELDDRYVNKTGDETITGRKSFDGGIDYRITAGNDFGVGSLDVNGINAYYSNSLYGGNQISSGSDYLYIKAFDVNSNESTIRVQSSGGAFYGPQFKVFAPFHANSIIKIGGASNEFLKADGSVDSNNYVTESETYIQRGNDPVEDWDNVSVGWFFDNKTIDGIEMLNRPPNGATNYRGHSFGTGANNLQIGYADNNASDIYIRHNSSGGFNNWGKLLTSDNLQNLSDLNDDILSGKYLQTKAVIGDYNTSSALDLNTIHNGIFYASTSALNKPQNLNSHILTQSLNADYVQQIGGRANRLFFRHKEGGNWHPWNELYHTGNHRTDSENDARYLQSLPEHNHRKIEIQDVRDLDTVNSSVNYMPTPNEVEDYSATAHFGYFGLGESWLSALTMKGWSDGYGAWQIAGEASTTSDNRFWLRAGDRSTWLDWVEIYHSGNLRSNTENDARYLQSFSESDTLSSVTARGNSTDSDVIFNGVIKQKGSTWMYATNNAYQRWDVRDENSTQSGIYLYGKDTSDNTVAGSFNIYKPGVGYRNIKASSDSLLLDDTHNIWHDGNLTNLSQLSNDAGFITGLSWSEVTGKPTFNISNWDTAYSWGNHANAGYLTNFSETDTLQSVLDRGNSALNQTITVTNGATLQRRAILGLGKLSLHGGSGGNNYMLLGQEGGGSTSYIDSSTTLDFKMGGSTKARMLTDGRFQVSQITPYGSDGLTLYGDFNDGTGRGANVVIGGNGSAIITNTIGDTNTDLSGEFNITNRSSSTLGSVNLTNIGSFTWDGNNIATQQWVTSQGYDDYSSWSLKVNSGPTNFINSGEVVDFIAGDNMTISRNGGQITFASSGGSGSGGGGTPIKGNNLAFGVIPTSNTVDGSHSDFSYSTDGNFNTENYTKFAGINDTTQSTSGSEIHYLQIDLGAVYDCFSNEIYFYDGDSRSYYYNLQYSTDGTNWNYVVGSSGTFVLSEGVVNSPDVIETTVSARYWRMYGNGNTVNAGNHIYEWEIYENTGGSIATFNGGTITQNLSIHNSAPALTLIDNTTSSPIDQSANVRFDGIDANLPNSESGAVIIEANNLGSNNCALISEGNIYMNGSSLVATQSWVNSKGYDKYSSWSLKVNSGATNFISSGEVVNLIAGNNMTITRNGGDITFDAAGGSGGSWNGGTVTNATTFDYGTNTTLLIKSDDTGSSKLELYGDAQGTGHVYVGQSTSYGGGIEYNGDNSPSITGAGSDYVTLFRKDNGTYNWTARNKYDSNVWEFRTTPTVGSTPLATQSWVQAQGYGTGSGSWNGGTVTNPTTFNTTVQFNGVATMDLNGQRIVLEGTSGTDRDAIFWNHGATNIWGNYINGNGDLEFRDNQGGNNLLWDGDIIATRTWVAAQGYGTGSGTDTNYYLSNLTFSGGTLTATVNGASNQSVSIDGRYLRLTGGTLSGNLTAPAFYESSLREYKENIEPFKLSGLDLIKGLDIVTFDRKDGVKNKIGIIADDTTPEFLSDEKNAVDLYKTIFIQAKAIQELNDKVERLERLVEKLME